MFRSEGGLPSSPLTLPLSDTMNHKVTVMPNKGQLYLPATMKLRSRGFGFASVTELSRDKIKIKLSQRPTRSYNERKLMFDGKVKRQHTKIKDTGLARFMETVHPDNVWNTNDVRISAEFDFVEITLTPV